MADDYIASYETTLPACSAANVRRAGNRRIRLNTSWVRQMFKHIRNWLRRRQHQEGKILRRFIARDVRREILIVSAAKVEEGIIIGRVRTTNVLYVTHHLARKSEFGPPQELLISEMWHWTGQPWGGLSDGTSLVARPNVKPHDGET